MLVGRTMPSTWERMIILKKDRKLIFGLHIDDRYHEHSREVITDVTFFYDTICNG